MMKEYVAIVAAAMSGAFAVVSACIAWWLKSHSDRAQVERTEAKEKHAEIRELYTRAFRLFEDAARLIHRDEGASIEEDFARLNADMHLLGSDAVAGLYEKAAISLSEWSRLYAKATPRQQKIGDQTLTILQAPDPTAKYKEPERQAFEDLQEKLRALHAQMKAELRSST
jgi:hypothetical protein